MDKKKFDKYLTLRNSAGDIRFVAIFNILMFSDLLGILPLYGEPRISFFIYVGIVPALILNIWAILYVVAPYRFESSFILFYGVWGMITSFLYFVVVEKYLYSILHLETWLYFFLGLLFYLVSVAAVLVTQHLLIYDKLKPLKGPGAWPKVMAFIPAFSFIFSQFLFSTIKSDDIKALIFAGCMAALMLLMLLFVQYIHQYFFFIKHKEALLAKYPNLDKPKKQRVFRDKSKNHKHKSKKHKHGVDKKRKTY